MRVLVIEDELLVALNLETVLLEAGCEVIGPIASLQAALKASASEEADLAILDINLRGEEVFPAAHILRERGIPLIFCSGYSDAQTLPEPFRSFQKLGKPYGATEVRDAMRRVLTAREKGLTSTGS
ncbi:regulatory protein [Lutibaculum baratangense AMV1]|uniref:Regulatory protein n=1 Tax=Lutibaculum baratangense AMV1 TaxID=631454 RepID=V4TBW7_9HYPH|nr:regulatory protein [Lutibaculum baratangense AMV1]